MVLFHADKVAVLVVVVVQVGYSVPNYMAERHVAVMVSLSDWPRAPVRPHQDIISNTNKVQASFTSLIQLTSNNSGPLQCNIWRCVFSLHIMSLMTAQSNPNDTDELSGTRPWHAGQLKDLKLRCMRRLIVKWVELPPWKNKVRQQTGRNCGCIIRMAIWLITMKDL